MLTLFHEDPNSKLAVYIANVIKEYRYSAYFIGHCVRNYLFGRPISKYSLVTDMPIMQLRQILWSKKHEQKEPNLQKYLFEQTSPEITFKDGSFRTIVYPMMERRVYGGIIAEHPKTALDSSQKLEKDIAHRAFTLETIYYDPFEGSLIDPHSGFEDIRTKRLKPIDRGYNQKLRINPDLLLRSLALMSEYSLIASEQINLCNEGNPDLFDNIPKSKIRKYLPKCLYDSCGLENLVHCGIIDKVLPTVRFLEKCPIKDDRYWLPGRPEDLKTLYDHTLAVIDNLGHKYPNSSSQVRIAALLHEVGRAIEGNENPYTKASDIIAKLLSNEKTLNYPVSFVESVKNIVFYLEYALKFNHYSEDQKLWILHCLQDGSAGHAESLVTDICALAHSKVSASKEVWNNNPTTFLNIYRAFKDRLEEPPFITRDFIKDFYVPTDKTKTTIDPSLIKSIYKTIRVNQLKGHIKNQKQAEMYIHENFFEIKAKNWMDHLKEVTTPPRKHHEYCVCRSCFAEKKTTTCPKCKNITLINDKCSWCLPKNSLPSGNTWSASQRDKLICKGDGKCMEHSGKELHDKLAKNMADIKQGKIPIGQGPESCP